jgi:4,5-DOPA dioxygenase extradiol
MNTSPRLPTLFVSHGSPMLAIEDSPTARFLQSLGAALPRPDAILVASAHFLADAPRLGAAVRPSTLHDFGNFPPALHAVQYPAPGAPALAARAVDLLGQAGIAAASVADRPLDHGIWVALRRMYPEADIPVVPLSIQPDAGAAAHARVGAALAALRSEGVLVIGSGGASHNLRALDWRGGDGTLAPWVAQFVDWVAARLDAGDTAALLDWERQAPQAQRNHPTPEHFLPMFVALGAGAGDRAQRLNPRHEMGALALDAWQFG